MGEKEKTEVKEKIEEKVNEENNQKDNKKEKVKKNNILMKIITILIVIFAIVELSYGGYMIYEKYKAKFKDVEIEIGTREAVSIEDFLKSEKYLDNSILVTNLEDVNFNAVGEYSVILSHDGREEEVLLKLVDTTAPEVTFQDLEKYIDYELNAEDFIVEKSDLSEMKVEIKDAPEINNFGEYEINVIVSDSSGNETSNICKLSVIWIKKEYKMEKGDSLTKEDLLYNADEDSELLDESELKKIRGSEIGTYEIKTEKDGIEITTVITVTDLTPPTLVLKSVTIYNDETSTVKGKESFIKNVSDASGEVTTTLKTEIDYSYIGTQDIVIEATDKYGNVTKETTTLTIKKDTVGPAFSGLSTLTITKGSTINYTSGVTAKDAKDRKM